MSTIGKRLASWFWRDLQLRSGFREVIDQITDGHLLLEYWEKRIDEEIGDNRFISALEQIRDINYRGNRHESAFIAIRALGPAKVEQAAKLGVTQFAADGGAHRVEQLTLAPVPEHLRVIVSTVTEMKLTSIPPAPSPDDFL